MNLAIVDEKNKRLSSMINADNFYPEGKLKMDPLTVKCLTHNQLLFENISYIRLHVTKNQIFFLFQIIPRRIYNLEGSNQGPLNIVKLSLSAVIAIFTQLDLKQKKRPRLHTIM